MELSSKSNPSHFMINRLQFYLKSLCIILLVLGIHSTSFSQTPFSCTGLVYQVAGPVARQNVTLYSYNINTGERTQIAPLGRSINAIGYNPIDNMIWGFDQNSNVLVRIDALGTVTPYTIPNLPNDIYNSSDFLPDGRMLFYRTDTGTQTRTYYVVDLNPRRTATYLKLVDPTLPNYPLEAAPYGTTMSQLTLTNDMAYNPTTGLMVGIGTNANARKIVRLNPQTGAVTVQSAPVTGDGFETTAGPYGASFIDSGNSNVLYVFANNPGSYYRIDLLDNTATLLSQSIAAGNNDGASCPSAILSFPISGNVFNDTNAMKDNTVNGSGTNAGGLNAVLYDNTTGEVVAVHAVNSDGTYSFGATPGNNYTVYITTSTPTVGQTAKPVPSLPSSWNNTGENLGTQPGSDGTTDGILAIGDVNEPVENVNFGISNAPLPVGLMNFSIRAQENGSVLVSWNTAWEESNQKFIIERSIDLKEFKPVGEIQDVAGTDNGANNYRFVDDAPFSGTSYYRLKQIDLDGTVTIYRIQSVIVDATYDVFPNPVSSGSGFTLTLDEVTTADIKLYSIAGNPIAITKTHLNGSSVKITPYATLKSGIYILNVRERGTVRKYRILVQ